jgi:nucleotide-binding universal stress UspA family protein
VGGSPNSFNAVKVTARIAGLRPADSEIHLLNVQSPLPAAATEFVAADVVRRYHQEEGDSALSAALSLIEAGGHKHQAHVIVGDVAATIAGCARRWKCDQIIMGRADMAQFKGCCWDP